jgi:hypothetical protein
MAEHPLTTKAVDGAYRRYKLLSCLMVALIVTVLIVLFENLLQEKLFCATIGYSNKCSESSFEHPQDV